MHWPEEIKLDALNLKANLDLQGITLDIDYTKEVDCNFAKGFYGHLILIKNHEKYQKLILDCTIHFDPVERFVLAERPFAIDKETTFKNKLAKVSGSTIKEDIKVLNQVFETKKSIVGDNQWLSLFKEIDRTSKLKGLKKENSLQDILAKIDDKGKHIYADLLKVLIALELGNKGWARDLLMKIMMMDRAEIIFMVQPYFFKLGLPFETFKSVLIKIMTLIKEKYPDLKMARLLATYFYDLFPGEEKEVLKDEFDSEWTLQELRNMIKSPNYGIDLPSLWFPLLYKPVSHGEMTDYVNKVFAGHDLKQEYRKILWLVAYHVPQDDQVRKNIVNTLAKLYSSTDLYERDLFFRLMENAYLRDQVLSKLSKKKKPLFSMKRSFYKEMLFSGKAIEYALYNLVALGDMKREYQWWLLPLDGKIK